MGIYGVSQIPPPERGGARRAEGFHIRRDLHKVTFYLCKTPPPASGHLPFQAEEFEIHLLSHAALNYHLCAFSAASSAGASGCSVKLYFHSFGVMVYSGCTCAPHVLSPPTPICWWSMLSHTISFFSMLPP